MAKLNVANPSKPSKDHQKPTHWIHICWCTTLLWKYGTNKQKTWEELTLKPMLEDTKRTQTEPSAVACALTMQSLLYVFKLQTFKNEFTRDALRPKPSAKALLRYPNVATICCCHQRCGLPAHSRDICSSLTLLRQRGSITETRTNGNLHLYLTTKDDSRVWNTIHRRTYASVGNVRTIPAKKHGPKSLHILMAQPAQETEFLCFSLQNGTRHYQHPDNFNSSKMSMLMAGSRGSPSFFGSSTVVGIPAFPLSERGYFPNHWRSGPASIKVVITSPFPAPSRGQVKLHCRLHGLVPPGWN